MTLPSIVPGSLWAMFARSAERRADATALDFGTHSVSFYDLYDAALRAAGQLVSLGVRSGDVVALQLQKRPVTYALMLGCLAIGAVYCPLDPNNPASRTGKMLARLQPKILFSTVGTSNPFGLTVGVDKASTLADQIAAWPLAGVALPSPPSNSTHPAYVMFTSGSTGEPKGAVIPQQGVLSLMRWASGLLGAPDAQRFTALNPLHFDNSVFDFYCGLVAGGTLVPIEISEATRPAQWVERINDSRASVVFSVPTLLLLLDQSGALVPARLPHVRLFMFGGEGYPLEQLRRLHEAFASTARLVNVYGPTETSCICSSIEVDAAALAASTGGLVSLGVMHPEFAYRILSDDGAPVPAGDIGELWIGGGNVGLGYFGNPEETARRFAQDPLQSNYRSIYYRSGDLVRQDTAGALWFHGRKDNQIKIGGHRIELEEVDAAVEAFDGIRRSLTILVAGGSAPHLVTAFEGLPDIPTAELAEHLQARLPAYMRPSRLLQLSSLPTNANGKVARLAIQALVAAPEIRLAPVAHDTESLIRNAWRIALGHDRFSLTDNFFDLGGTSLALMRVHAELSAKRPETISMTDLFEHPTIARITAFLDGTPVVAQTSVHAVTSRAGKQQAMLQRLHARKGSPSS